MPRTTIDFHKDRRDAAAAFGSLRDVGLNAGDVGGAWLAEDQPAGQGSGHGVEVMDLGLVAFSGWLAEAALKVASPDRPVSLATLLEGHSVTPEDLDRIHRTLTAGGGIIGVRARDAFNPPPEE